MQGWELGGTIIIEINTEIIIEIIIESIIQESGEINPLSDPWSIYR